MVRFGGFFWVLFVCLDWIVVEKLGLFWEMRIFRWGCILSLMMVIFICLGFCLGEVVWYIWYEFCSVLCLILLSISIGMVI